MYQTQPRFSTAGPQVGTAGLLGRVFGITGVGFVLTAVASYLFRDVAPGVGLIAFIAAFALIFVISAQRRNQQAALLWFYAFTFLEGIGLAPTIHRYVLAFGQDVVVNAAGTTGAGMLVLGAVANLFSVDWRRFTSVAFGLLLALIVVGFISFFFHLGWIQPTTYAWLTLGVFTLWTLIDFSRIRAGGGGATAVDLALSIYLDALNIFIALLQIFGSRSSSRD
jgi:modulator of FtsH protease